MTDTIIKRLEKFITDNRLIQKGKLGIGVSGGPDSVFLLYALNSIKEELKIELHVLHFNHKLRNEADSEENFVRELSKKLNIHFVSDFYNIEAFAELSRLSVEEASRIKRYEFFEKSAKRFDLNSIALAHTKNDVAETFLLNMLRGASSKGLTSLKIKRGIYIRPVLFLKKDEIISFLNENNIQFKTDSSNFQTKFTRNRIRLKLMNELSKFNPNITETLYKEYTILARDNDYLENQAEKSFIKSLTLFNKQTIILDLNKMDKQEAVKSRVISKAAQKLLNTPYSISFDNIERIMTLKKGKIVVLRKKLKAYIQNNRLIMEKL